MKVAKNLSTVWLKAAILGSLWASSEIVLGSFLHNLRVPFTGHILTAIGITLLISASHLWSDKGLFWRAGLICAIMKSVSPSSVILGPMIAILSEALLIELAVSTLGRNVAGYITGGLLAMSWTFFYKLAMFVVSYGYGIIDLYTNLAHYTEKQLNTTFDSIWTPLYILWAVYLGMGIIASVAGIYTGRKARKQKITSKEPLKSLNFLQKRNQSNSGIKTSLIWLFFNTTALISVMFMMNFLHWTLWGLTALGVLTLWGIRYHRALHALKKPGFWIIFITITMLSGLLIVKMGNSGQTLMDGLIIGLQMNLRAAIFMTGFSITGTELSNPIIKRFFEKTAFRQLAPALTVAFDTIPFVMSNIPDLKSFFKRPLSIIYEIVARADMWLDEVIQKQKHSVILITGAIGSGKTTFLQEITNNLKQKGITVAGILSHSLRENGKNKGYDLYDIVSENTFPLARLEGESSMMQAGQYFFNAETMEKGKQFLSADYCKEYQVIIIDELGFLELEGQGWADAFEQHMADNKIVICAVRDFLLEIIKNKWNLEQAVIFDVQKEGTEKAARLIFDKMGGDSKKG